MRTLEPGDVEAVVARVLDALAEDAAHNPLIATVLDSATLGASLRDTRDSCLVAVENDVVLGHLYAVVLASRAGPAAWSGPDGWSGEEAVMSQLREVAYERWREGGVLAHHAWVRDDDAVLAPWLATGYRVEDVRGLRELNDLPEGASSDRVRRGERRVETALHFDELIDAANFEAPLRGLARRERRRFLGELLEDPETTQYLLEGDGTVLAHCIAFAVEPTRATSLRTLHVSAVAVEPRAQRRGLVRELVLAVLAEAAASGFTHAQVTWRPENVAASHLWRALGFRSTYARLVSSI